jgi:hypothetical protein
VNGELVEEDIPMQLHLSRVKSYEMTPGNMLVVPLTFLPRYPHNNLDIDKPMPSSDYINGGTSAPSLTVYQRSDLGHLIGPESIEGRPYFSDSRRNNLKYDPDCPERSQEYEVKSSVKIETSHGDMVFPFSATSLRSNPYRVPERILFHPAKQSHVRVMRNTGALLLQAFDLDHDAGNMKTWPSFDCYEVYIHNPWDEPLKVLEASASKPDVVRLYNTQIDPNFHNPMMDWNGEDSVVEPGADAYVTTVCPVGAQTPAVMLERQGIQVGDDFQFDLSKFDINMGYLYVKTEHDTLFTLLEWYLTEDDFPEQPSRTYFYEIAQKGDGRLRSSPSNLETHLVPFITPKASISFNIENHLQVPIKIMRMSLFVDQSKVNAMKDTKFRPVLTSSLSNPCSDVNEEGGVNLDQLNESLCMERRGLIRGRSVWKHAGSLDFSIASNLTTDYLRLDDVMNEVSGAIVVLGTITNSNITYQEWREQLRQNPHSQMMTTLEIYWTVKFVDGQVYAVVERSTAPHKHLRHQSPPSVSEAADAFFFPFEPLDSRDWTYWHGGSGRTYDYNPEGIEHRVRLAAFSHMPLNITSLHITWNKRDRNSKICRRFQLSLNPPVSNESLGGLYDLGSLYIRYTYDEYHDEYHRREGKAIIGQAIHPTVCSLSYQTEPVFTGEHTIKLVVFSGKLEITTHDPGTFRRHDGISGNPTFCCGRNNVLSADIGVGFDEALQWFERSATGKALMKNLRSFDKKSAPASLLREYILKLARVTEGGVDEREGFVEPILLHAGAVAHGEIITIPLYLTNHNPVPVQVFFDVCEVEGMRVTISRETPRLRGDGNSVVDYLPSKVDPEFDRIRDGKWATHSREGLKRFLLNNNYASSFLSLFRYRDAIERSTRATSKMKLLHSLYKKRAKQTFHVDMFSLSLYSEKRRGCDGNEKAPSNIIDINATVKGYPGPTLLSDDMTIKHHNTICDPSFRQDPTTYPRTTDMRYLKHLPVTIPPGGVARFDVKVRAPGRDILLNDVTSLLSTGLVLSTDHGQIMPIVVTFEALLGHLKLTRSPGWIESKRTWQTKDGFSHQYNGEIVDVPLQLFTSPLEPEVKRNNTPILIAPSLNLPSTANFTTWNYPLGASNVTLFLGSSFSREITLLDLQSCNPWFYVNLRTDYSDYLNGKSTGRDSIKIGTLHTHVTCPSMFELLEMYHEVDIPDNAAVYPCFYQCALEWLENRTLLQAYGCGIHPMPKSVDNIRYGVEEDATERTLDALNQAITYSMFRYGSGRLKYEDDRHFECASASVLHGDDNSSKNSLKSGVLRTNPTVDRLTLDIYSEITNAWRIITELDLNSITSSLKATVEYTYEKGRSDHSKMTKTKQNLTVSMRDVVLRTKLSMPNLVQPQRKYMYVDQNDNENDFFSVLEFPPTAVANVASLKIPLKNPTGVPVKVRLATISWEELIRDAAKAEKYHTLATDEVRELYLEKFESVYTQTGCTSPIQSPGRSWWEGVPSFYQADDQGNLILARQNFTLKSGGRSHLSFVNPSIYTHSAFLVGCGGRCGLRDERSPVDRFEIGLQKASSMGASAAVGASLTGRLRGSMSDVDYNFMDEPTLSAGGIPDVDEAPAAFAVPYSAFDEITLPPFGEAELGPVLFRPTGRYSLMGCDSLLENDAIPWGDRVAEKCGSMIFQSMVLLENSLTGLERVILRGKGLWESVVFIDPIGSDAFDAFGDLELRNGHTTMLFPGSCVSDEHGGTKPHPVIKGVILHNEGDIDVEFSTAFFSDSPRLGSNKREKISANHGCVYRGFRLLECSESEGPVFQKQERIFTNIYHGFSIPAGSNRTLFIEHLPDCTFSSDFVFLNFEFRSSPSSGSKLRSRVFRSSPEEQLGKPNAPGERPKRRRGMPGKSLKRHSLQLQVGYEMSPDDLKSCIPVHADSFEPAFVSGSRNVSHWNNKTAISPTELTRLKRALSIGDALRRHLGGGVKVKRTSVGKATPATVASLAMVMLVLVTLVMRWRSVSSQKFRTRLMGPPGRKYEKDRRASIEGPQSSWTSTFRCLARADPTSSELQTIGREQIRQVVLNRYKTLGGLPPQCIDSSGVFCREGSQHLRGGVAANNKMKTLSETIFRLSISSKNGGPDSGLLPCGLSWKATAVRGLIGKKAVISAKLRSDGILSRRQHEEHAPSGRAEASSSQSMDTVLGQRDIVRKPERRSAPGTAGNFFPSADSNEHSVNNDNTHDYRILVGTVTRLSSSDSVSPSENSRIIEEEPFTTHVQSRSRRRPGKSDDVLEPKSAAKAQTSRSRRGKPDMVLRSKSDDTSSTESSSLIRVPSEIQGGKVAETIPEGKTDGSYAQTDSEKKSRNNGKQMGQKNKRSVEPASPSSLKSVSSRSTNQTESTASPSTATRSGEIVRKIRPPPGLAPPPGFGGTETFNAALDLSSTSLHPPSLMELPAATQDYSPPLSSILPINLDRPPEVEQTAAKTTGTALDQLYSTSSTSLFHTIRATDEHTFEVSHKDLTGHLHHDSSASLEALATPILQATASSSSQNPEQSRTSFSGAGFDVMSFLDNLLDESANRNISDPSGAAAPFSISSDPWGGPQSSRAAAYGISVADDEGDDDDDDDDGIVQAILATPRSGSEPIPLLTPQALAGAALNHAVNVDEGDKSKHDYDSGDFYARLLGE